MFGKWNNIKKDGLPKESGYYLVAIERMRYRTKEKYYDTNYIFFRGKTIGRLATEVLKPGWSCRRNIKESEL